MLRFGVKWMADRDDYMSKKQDLRNGREQGNWKPGRWTPQRAHLKVRHARRHSLLAIPEIAASEVTLEVTGNVINNYNLALSKLGILMEFGEDRLRELYPNG